MRSISRPPQMPVVADAKTRDRALSLGVEMYVARFGDEPPPKARADFVARLEDLDAGAKIALTEAVHWNRYEVFSAAVTRRQGT